MKPYKVKTLKHLSTFLARRKRRAQKHTRQVSQDKQILKELKQENYCV